MVHQRIAISLDDFITGVLLGLASTGIQVVSIRNTAFYIAMRDTFNVLASKARSESALDLQFSLTEPYGSPDYVRFSEAMARAQKRDLISWDNPSFLDIRLRPNPKMADRYLEDVPGGRELYVELAQELIRLYPNRD